MKRFTKVFLVALSLLGYSRLVIAIPHPIVGKWVITNTTESGCKDPQKNSANPCKNTETTRCWVIVFTAGGQYIFENAPGATGPETGTYSVSGNVLTSTSPKGVASTTFTLVGDVFTFTIPDASTGCTLSFIFSRLSAEPVKAAAAPSDNSTVKIGSQLWMLKDLNVSVFANGDPILQVKTTEEWRNAMDKKTPAWCYYDYDPSNEANYGRMYNWYAVNDPRGLAPKGWHVASDTEWNTLADQVGGVDNAAVALKNTTGWDSNGNGTNSSGFAALPGGGLQTTTGNVINFYGIRQTGNWWTSTEFNDVFAWARILQKNNNALLRAVGKKNDGGSVRCIKD